MGGEFDSAEPGLTIITKREITKREVSCSGPHKADRSYPQFQPEIPPTPDIQAPLPLYKTTQ